jgi:hypothetical protein
VPRTSGREIHRRPPARATPRGSQGVVALREPQGWHSSLRVSHLAPHRPDVGAAFDYPLLAASDATQSAQTLPDAALGHLESMSRD